MKKCFSLVFIFFWGCPVEDMILLDNSTWISREAIEEIAASCDIPPGTYMITYTSDVFYASEIPVKKVIILTSDGPMVIGEGDTLTMEMEGRLLAFFLDIYPNDNYGEGVLRMEGDGSVYFLTVSGVYNVLNVGDYVEYFSAVRISPGDYVLSFSSDLESGEREIKRVLLYNTTDNDPYGWFWVLNEGEEKEITVTGEGLDAEYLYGTVIATEEPSGRGEVRIERLP